MKLSIFHVNIRSLNKHHNDLIIYLSMLDTKFDVICLSEIWSYNLEFYKAIFPGYIAHFQSPTDTHVGGVALFIKNENKTTERKDLKIVNSDAVKVEDLWFEVTNTDDETFLISVIYRHPKGNVNHFSDSIENSITKIIDDRKIKDCIIVGDMNIDLIKYNIHQSTAEFLSTMLIHGFMPTILLPTRVTNHSCTLIDHIFYYSKTFKDNFISGNLFTDITDHFANFLILESKKKSLKKDRPNIRIFSDKNKDKFKMLLTNVNWEQELKGVSVDEAMNLYYQKLHIAYNKSFPFVKLSRRRAKDKPWITTALKKSIQEKQRLYKRYKFNHSTENEKLYKRYNNQLGTHIRQCEGNYFKDLFNDK